MVWMDYLYLMEEGILCLEGEIELSLRESCLGRVGRFFFLTGVETLVV